MNREQFEWEEECRTARLDEQDAKSDFAYEHDGSIEKCECGCAINSDNRCPSCDY